MGQDKFEDLEDVETEERHKVVPVEPETPSKNKPQPREVSRGVGGSYVKRNGKLWDF